MVVVGNIWAFKISACFQICTANELHKFNQKCLVLITAAEGGRGNLREWSITSVQKIQPLPHDSNSRKIVSLKKITKEKTSKDNWRKNSWLFGPSFNCKTTTFCNARKKSTIKVKTDFCLLSSIGEGAIPAVVVVVFAS